MKHLFSSVKNKIYSILGKSSKKVFSDIHKKNLWGGNESVSGPGSDMEQVKVLIGKIPEIVKEYKIKSIVDIPCGDFNWMRYIDLKDVKYTGGDIVTEIVRRNNDLHKKDNISFIDLDIVKDNIPNADMILCRDCLVHFPFGLIRKAISNIKKSNSEYLLMTYFPKTVKNSNIKIGEWRPLNFTLFPFNFPDPICVINENCTENNGAYKDKSLALWRIKELPNMEI